MPMEYYNINIPMVFLKWLDILDGIAYNENIDRITIFRRVPTV